MNGENSWEQNVKASMAASRFQPDVEDCPNHTGCKEKIMFEVKCNILYYGFKSDVRLISVALLTQFFELLVSTCCMTL